jgi:hypothetical protein
MLAYEAATTTTTKVDTQLEVVEEGIYKVSDREREAWRLPVEQKSRADFCP